MSLRAMLWALHDAPVSDPLSKLVLLAMADGHSEDTGYTFLGVRTIADTVPCDRATVQRHLRMLERDGVIVRAEDQSAAAYLRADRRPTVYLLGLPGRTVRPRPMLTGPQDPPSRGRNGAAPARPDPKNQERNLGVAARRETADGAVAGCALHRDRRRPACEDCTRVVPLHREQVKPADPSHAKAARAALRRTR